MKNISCNSDFAAGDKKLKVFMQSKIKKTTREIQNSTKLKIRQFKATNLKSDMAKSLQFGQRSL